MDERNKSSVGFFTQVEKTRSGKVNESGLESSLLK